MAIAERVLEVAKFVRTANQMADAGSVECSQCNQPVPMG